MPAIAPAPISHIGDARVAAPIAENNRAGIAAPWAVKGITVAVAKSGAGRADPLPTIIDAVIEAHQQAGVFGRSRLDIAKLRHLILDLVRIQREFQTAGEGGIIGNDEEALPLRCRQLAFEARYIGAERRGAGGEAQRDGGHGGQPCAFHGKQGFHHGKFFQLLSQRARLLPLQRA